MTSAQVSATGNSRHENNFNLARLLGATLVVLGHSFILTGLPTPAFGSTGVQTLGVKIFFVISGYLIAKSWLSDRNMVRYMSKRLLRILPALFVVVLLSSFIVGPLLSRLPLVEYFKHPGPYIYLENMALYIQYFLPGVFENNIYKNAFNGSLWSLPVECAMYLAVPIILGPRGTIRNWLLPATLVASLLATSYAQNWSNPEQRWIFYATNIKAALVLVPYFVFGSLMTLPAFDPLTDIGVAFLVLFLTTILAVSGAMPEWLLVPALGYTIVSFGKSKSVLPWTNRFDISYGLYLYSFPIQQIISQLFPGQIIGIAMFWTSLAITLIPALLSWLLVEQHFLRLKSALQGSRFFTAEASAKATTASSNSR